MPAKAGKAPKLTPAEKAAAKARAAALKARNAEYKKVAKLIKAKDPVKRSEGLDIVSQDFEFLTAGNCLVPLVDSLVPTKKNVDVVMRGLSTLKDFLSGQQHSLSTSGVDRPEANVAFLLLAMATKQETFKGLATVSSLLLDERQGTELPALRVIKLVVDFLLLGQSTQHLGSSTLSTSESLFLQTESLPTNLGLLYSRLRADAAAASSSPSSAAAALNEILAALAFIGKRAPDRLASVVGDDKTLSAIISSLQDKDLLQRAALLIDIVSKQEEGLRRVAKSGVLPVVANVLEVQLEFIRSSDVVQKAMQEAAVAAAAAANVGKEVKASSKHGKGAKGGAGGGAGANKKEEEAAAAVAAVGSAADAPNRLNIVLESLARVVDVLTRLCVAESADRLDPSSPISLESIVRSLVGTIQLPMPRDLRKVYAISVCQALTAIIGKDEARRVLVRNAGAMGPLLDLVVQSDPSAEGLTIRRAAEKALHHIILPLSPSAVNVDDSILTGSGDVPAYLNPRALLAALSSEDPLTWQVALRLVARLTSADESTTVLGTAALPALHKIVAWLHANAATTPFWPPPTGSSSSSSPAHTVPTKTLLIALADTLTSFARSKDQGLAQAVGTEDMVSHVVGLVQQGPLSATDFFSSDGFSDRKALCCYATGTANHDVPFKPYGPEQWKLDLSGLEDGAMAESIVPRARLVRVLNAVGSAGGTGGALVVERAAEAVMKLLAVDMDVGGQRRSWEVFVPKDQALLHDQLRLELLNLVSAVATLHGGREKLLESMASFHPSWASEGGEENAGGVKPAAASWTPPTAFQMWDLTETEQSQALHGALPYLRVLAGVMSPIYDAATEPAMVDAGIRALSSLCWDKNVAEGAQEAVVDNLAGMAMSMGAVTPLVSYASKAGAKTTAGTLIKELTTYLLNRGMARQDYWANVSALPQEDPVDPKAKGKAPAKKKLSPEEEAKLKELANQKGRPDPNRGPNAEQWTRLLNVPCKDTRTGKDRSTAMLAMIIAKETDLLEKLFQAGAKPVAVDERGRTPLMDALMHGSNAAAIKMVELGADVNACDYEGTTVLKCAFVSPDKKEFDEKVKQLQSSSEQEVDDSVAGIPTPKMLAGEARLLRFLLEHGADPNVADDDGNFPLHWALTGTYVTTYDEGLEITLTSDIRRKSLLPVAFATEEQQREHEASNDIKPFEALIEFGADVNLVNKVGQSPLSRAIRAGRLDKAYELLRLGADPNVLDGKGFLPLHYACMVSAVGYDQLVETLLASGTNRLVHTRPFKDIRKGRTSLQKYSATVESVLDGGFPEASYPSVITQKLRRAGELLTLPTYEGYISLHYACGVGRERGSGGVAEMDDLPTRQRIVQLILGDLEVDINGQGASTGLTALHALAQHVDSPDLLQLLLQQGADVNSIDAQGMTPLTHALRGHNARVAEALVHDARTKAVEAGVTVNALTYAVAGVPGLPSGVLHTLLQRTKRVDPELATLNVCSPNYGPVLGDDLGPLRPLDGAFTNPLCAAAYHGTTEAVEMLVSEPKLNVNLKDGPLEESALHVASKRGHQRIVELLCMVGGIQVVARNKQGQTSLYLAVQADHLGIAAVLLDIQAVRQAVLQESEDPQHLPSTLHLAETLNMKGAPGSDDAVKLLLSVLGDRLRRSVHVHECFAQGVTYGEWVAAEQHRQQQQQQQLAAGLASSPPGVDASPAGAAAAAPPKGGGFLQAAPGGRASNAIKAA